MIGPSLTIRGRDLRFRDCLHCGTKTWQVGISGYHCLQCIADGGTCCSLLAFNRHVANPAQPPR